MSDKERETGRDINEDRPRHKHAEVHGEHRATFKEGHIVQKTKEPHNEKMRASKTEQRPTHTTRGVSHLLNGRARYACPGENARGS